MNNRELWKISKCHNLSARMKTLNKFRDYTEGWKEERYPHFQLYSVLYNQVVGKTILMLFWKTIELSTCPPYQYTTLIHHIFLEQAFSILQITLELQVWDLTNDLWHGIHVGPLFRVQDIMFQKFQPASRFARLGYRMQVSLQQSCVREPKTCFSLWSSHEKLTTMHIKYLPSHYKKKKQKSQHHISNVTPYIVKSAVTKTEIGLCW